MFNYQVKKFALYDLVHQARSGIYRAGSWRGIQDPVLCAANADLPYLIDTVRGLSVCAPFSAQLMTAGVILATIAASDFRSARSYEAKAGVGRIIKMQNMLKENTPMAQLGAVVLRELLNVVLIEELDVLCDPVSQAAAFDPNSRTKPSGTLESQHVTETPIFSNATEASSTERPVTFNRPSLHYALAECSFHFCHSRLVRQGHAPDIVEEAAREIDNPENWWRDDFATVQTDSWADFDASRLVEEIVPVDLPGMSETLFNLERDWVATVSGTGHF
ncbi:hypothetical protein B0J13DRAFT_534787 [Dactylonectria estremocensis]|uniref:Uncharacterized protein n=1 Tax=Dactylonectria estremocensis TaxID=1079267 RepID=A0A9P9CYM8_9HYPO|nr:hypothetical protein B0J13DRAFT_534787 [Dactylonectria estremocensis]